MIGVTLGQLVQDLRMEIGAATQVGQGVSVLPKHQYICRRTQEWLYDDFDWPHLQFNLDIPINIGQRYYSFPAAANVNPFRVVQGYPSVYYNSRWYPVRYGIGPAEYNLSDPMQSMAQDPIWRWQRYNDQSQGQQQFEIWPVPAATSLLRFRILQNLPSLIAANDTAVLDDKLIVLTAAAELMQSMKDPGFQMKQAAAKARYAAMKGNMDNDDVLVLGGGAPPMQEPDGSFIDRWYPLMAKGA